MPPKSLLSPFLLFTLTSETGRLTHEKSLFRDQQLIPLKLLQPQGNDLCGIRAAELTLTNVHLLQPIICSLHTVNRCVSSPLLQQSQVFSSTDSPLTVSFSQSLKKIPLPPSSSICLFIEVPSHILMHMDLLRCHMLGKSWGFCLFIHSVIQQYHLKTYQTLFYRCTWNTQHRGGNTLQSKCAAIAF